MGGEQATAVASMTVAEAANALRWWLDMGVDVAVQEEPCDWLAPPAPATTATAAVRESAAEFQDSGTDTDAADLDGFRAKLAAIPSPPSATSAGPILPVGQAESAIMLLADVPGAEEAADGRPIGGDGWRLAERMLAAIGVDVGDAYIASLSLFHSPGQRLAAEEVEACAALARRHVALARPKRLLLLGDGPARALIGKPLTQARGHVHHIEGVRTVATFSPRHLLEHTQHKALAWQDMLLLTEDDN